MIKIKLQNDLCNYIQFQSVVSLSMYKVGWNLSYKGPKTLTNLVKIQLSKLEFAWLVLEAGFHWVNLPEVVTFLYRLQIWRCIVFLVVNLKAS